MCSWEQKVYLCRLEHTFSFICFWEVVTVSNNTALIFLLFGSLYLNRFDDNTHNFLVINYFY